MTLTARLAMRRLTMAASDGVGAGAGAAAAALAVVNDQMPALDALTVSLCEGDSKYDTFVAAASPEGAPAASTSSALVARRLAEATKVGQHVGWTRGPRVESALFQLFKLFHPSHPSRHRPRQQPTTYSPKAASL